jgi:hypothetical protein
MKNTRIIPSLPKKLLFAAGLILLCAYWMTAIAQIQSVTPVQNLSFGAFYPGNNGGTVSISTNGTRTATGSVQLLYLGQPYCQARFEIQAVVGTTISILNSPDVTLTGSNGGTMSLHLDVTDPVSPFISNVAPPGSTTVNVGGTLRIGSPAQTPSGSYSGTFNLTFNYQ